MNWQKTVFALACGLSITAALATLGRAQQTSGANPSGSAAETTEEPAFRLRPGDTVDVRFFYNPELNESIQIRPDGHISLQLVGDVDVRSLTIGEATAKLETLYAKFLKTPSVSIQTKSLLSQKVYVGGEVNHPGIVMLTSRLSAFEAVMEAGGIKHTGNTSSLILIRKTEEGGKSLRKLSLKMANGQPSEAALMMLQPFDVVLISESKIARTDRWVDQYIRQTIPVTMTTGFTYLAGATVLP